MRSGPQRYANLAGVEVGDGFPVCVVGAINVSPESFYSGSVARGRRALATLARRMVAEGAAIVDVGAVSTAPYVHADISEAEECRRMTAAMKVLQDAVSVPISADTRRASVARAALEAGASIINDVGGLDADPAMPAVASHAGGLILMAAEGAASRIRPLPLIGSVLRRCLRRARAAGVPDERIVLDPGIGFFRNAMVPWYEFDCDVLHGLDHFRRLGRPLLVSVSRKSFIGRLTGRSDPAERLFGSLAAAAVAVWNGAALIRAHDVAATVDAVRVVSAIRGAGARRND